MGALKGVKTVFTKAKDRNGTGGLLARVNPSPSKKKKNPKMTPPSITAAGETPIIEGDTGSVVS